MGGGWIRRDWIWPFCGARFSVQRSPKCIFFKGLGPLDANPTTTDPSPHCRPSENRGQELNTFFLKFRAPLAYPGKKKNSGASRQKVWFSWVSKDIPTFLTPPPPFTLKNPTRPEDIRTQKSTPNMTGRRFHRTTEGIPSSSWKAKSPFASSPIKLSVKKGTRGVRTRYDTVLLPFISVVRCPRSFNHTGPRKNLVLCSFLLPEMRFSGGTWHETAGTCRRVSGLKNG